MVAALLHCRRDDNRSRRRRRARTSRRLRTRHGRRLLRSRGRGAHGRDISSNRHLRLLSIGSCRLILRDDILAFLCHRRAHGGAVAARRISSNAHESVRGAKALVLSAAIRSTCARVALDRHAVRVRTRAAHLPLACLRAAIRRDEHTLAVLLVVLRCSPRAHAGQSAHCTRWDWMARRQLLARRRARLRRVCEGAPCTPPRTWSHLRSTACLGRASCFAVTSAP